VRGGACRQRDAGLPRQVGCLLLPSTCRPAHKVLLLLLAWVSVRGVPICEDSIQVFRAAADAAVWDGCSLEAEHGAAQGVGLSQALWMEVQVGLYMGMGVWRLGNRSMLFPCLHKKPSLYCVSRSISRRPPE